MLLFHVYIFVSSGVSVYLLPLDLLALADTPSLSSAAVTSVINKYKTIDIVIHNAGQSMRGSVEDVAMSVESQIMKVNYLGTVSLTKAILPYMLKNTNKSGNIGNFTIMSSVQGLLPIAFRSCYAASKHALHGFFTALRYEVSNNNTIIYGENYKK